MVWPAAVYEYRLLSVPMILAGLVLEWLFYFFGLKLSWQKAARVDIVINAISTLIGLLAIPIAGILWEFFPGILLYKIFNIGSFSLITWSYTFVIAVVITSFVELFAAKKIFKIASSKNDMLVVLMANAVSVGVVFVCIFAFPVRMD